MIKPQIYPSIDPAPMGRGAPTVLYLLEPAQLWGAEVESLSGYVSRLAWHHRVHVTDLCRRILGEAKGSLEDLAPQSKWPLRTVNNGCHAHLWVSRLEPLTTLANLDLMTGIPLSSVLSDRYFFKATAAWCPQCLQASRNSDRTVYEPLYWLLDTAPVCWHHRTHLCDRCPVCGLSSSGLYKRSAPGYCGRCQAWLGRAAPMSEAAGEESSAWALTRATMALLAAQAQLANDKALSYFARNVGALIRVTGMAPLISLVQVPERTLHGWTSETMKPSLRGLIRLGLAARVDPVSLLTTDIAVPPRVTDAILENHRALRRPQQRAITPSRRISQPDLDALCEPYLAALRAGELPPSVLAVCRSIGVAPTTLERYEPELYAALHAANGARREAKRAAREARVRATLEELLTQTDELPRGAVIAHRLGVSWTYLEYTMPELLDAVVARRRSERVARRKEREAADEQMIRTIVAEHRAHHSRLTNRELMNRTGLSLARVSAVKRTIRTSASGAPTTVRPSS